MTTADTVSGIALVLGLLPLLAARRIQLPFLIAIAAHREATEERSPGSRPRAAAFVVFLVLAKAYPLLVLAGVVVAWTGRALESVGLQVGASIVPLAACVVGVAAYAIGAALRPTDEMG